MSNPIVMSNLQKFRELDRFSLPLNQFAITASGPLGIRGIREIGDVDIIVTDELWERLAVQYEVTDTGSVKKIILPGSDIEVLFEGSFYAKKESSDAPTVKERIAAADKIEGFPFESLNHVLYYKRKMGRDKDAADIKAIEEWLDSEKQA